MASSADNSLKRKQEDSDEPKKKVKTSDIGILTEIQNKLLESDNDIHAELELTKQKYYVSYFKKVLKELPSCSDVIDFTSIQENRDGFFKMFSVAKTCVNSHLQLKKLMAFNSLYDMINGLLGKFIHSKIISPNIKSFISEDMLHNAFSNYQQTLVCEDKNKTMELHCIAYLIQNEIDKNEPLKIPNPIFNRFTQQMTAVSKYITEIIKGIAMTSLQQTDIN